MDAMVGAYFDRSLLLVAQSIQYYIEEGSCRTQLLNPGLFQLSFNKTNSMIVHVDSKKPICFVLDVEKLLVLSILTCDNIDIKSKRINQIINRPSFILKI
ncbi:unnamed protein product [Rotaria sp. Silwood1]|nr:unnamed protein product [Rotaria sp. Silwood1]